MAIQASGIGFKAFRFSIQAIGMAIQASGIGFQAFRFSIQDEGIAFQASGIGFKADRMAFQTIGMASQDNSISVELGVSADACTLTALNRNVSADSLKSVSCDVGL